MRDANWTRVKVKSPQYLNLSGISPQDRQHVNKRRMVGIVQTNESSEFLSYFPEWTHLW